MGTEATCLRARLRRVALPAVVTMVSAGLVVLSGPDPAAAGAAGEITLVSHSPAGPTTTPLGSSQSPSTSADGSIVLFQSTSANIVAGQNDTNGVEDLFLFERSTGAVTLVSHTPASATTTANQASAERSISADGRFVVFRSTATNLVSGQLDVNPGSLDVFLFERSTGVVSLISHASGSATTTANSSSFGPVVAADGAFVAFNSIGTNLVPGQTDTNNTFDVFLFERATGIMWLVSHAPGTQTTTAAGASAGPTLSADSAFLAFHSTATNLVAGQVDTVNTIDVFLFERATGATTLVSHTPATATTTTNAASAEASLSSDGAFLVFRSQATNVVVGQTDNNGTHDLFLFERATGTTTLVSRAPANPTGTVFGTTDQPAISGDGTFVAFRRTTPPGVGTPGTNTVYLFDRTTGTVRLVSHTADGADVVGNGSDPSMSADGAFVAFRSGSPNMVAGQSNPQGAQVFLFARATGTITLVSHTPTSTTVGGATISFDPSISADGRVVTFHTNSPNLVDGQIDVNGIEDVFLFQRTGEQARPADFDGDGDIDVSVFRPSSGYWFVNGGAVTAFGTTADIPLPLPAAIRTHYFANLGHTPHDPSSARPYSSA